MPVELLALNKTYWCTKCNAEHRTATQLGVDHIVFDEDYVITKSEWKKMDKDEVKDHLRDLAILKRKAMKMKVEADKERIRIKELKLMRSKIEAERSKYINLVNLLQQTPETRMLRDYSLRYTDMGSFRVVPEEDIYEILDHNTEFISKISETNPILRANGKTKPGYYLVVKRYEIVEAKKVRSIYISHYNIIGEK